MNKDEEIKIIEQEIVEMVNLVMIGHRDLVECKLGQIIIDIPIRSLRSSFRPIGINHADIYLVQITEAVSEAVCRGRYEYVIEQYVGKPPFAKIIRALPTKE